MRGRKQIVRASELHLATSIRSFRAESLSDFVAAVLDGETSRSRSLASRLQDYPILLTRDLEKTRSWLRQRGRGTERYGLVASSNALRLKPVGINVRSSVEPTDWFLAGPADVRSSFALEDAATEFHIQGLELDWVGMCWDANLRRENAEWTYWNFRGTRWEKVRDSTRVNFLRNAYRVLLTRARQGMIIFVPEGSILDVTRAPHFYDRTFEFLQECGITQVL